MNVLFGKITSFTYSDPPKLESSNRENRIHKAEGMVTLGRPGYQVQPLVYDYLAILDADTQETKIIYGIRPTPIEAAAFPESGNPRAVPKPTIVAEQLLKNGVQTDLRTSDLEIMGYHQDMLKADGENIVRGLKAILDLQA